MRAEFEAAKWQADGDGTWLCFRMPHRQALSILESIAPDKPHELEVRRRRKRRSLDANAYYWQLCGQLAQAAGETPEAVYRLHIRDLGNYETICMRETAAAEFARIWTGGHLGRFTETRASKLPGCVTVLAYYGSSDFDTRQMSRLIDNCIQDCQAYGIETMTPAELASLKEAWHEPQDQGAADQRGGETPGV